MREKGVLSFVLFVLATVALLATLTGCALQRRQFMDFTRSYCEVQELTEAETGVRSTFVWRATCTDGRRLRCGATSVYGQGLQGVHCAPDETPPAAAATEPVATPTSAVAATPPEPAAPPPATAEPAAPPPEPAPAAAPPTPPPFPSTLLPPSTPVGPCDGIACSGHGRCIVAGAAPVCACEAGYVPDTAQVNCLAQ
jgi:hypothetical protein